MKILCTDLEGTLAPEIWQEIANEYQIKDLLLTTREIPNFEELMQKRMEINGKYSHMEGETTVASMR